MLQKGKQFFIAEWVEKEHALVPFLCEKKKKKKERKKIHFDALKSNEKKSINEIIEKLNC